MEQTELLDRLWIDPEVPEVVDNAPVHIRGVAVWVRCNNPTIVGEHHLASIGEHHLAAASAGLDIARSIKVGEAARPVLSLAIVEADPVSESANHSRVAAYRAPALRSSIL